MKKFKQEGWIKCEFSKPYKYMGIKNEPSVYLIVLKTQKGRKIIYVGSSKTLFRRIVTHPVINRLKRNIPNIKLEIWHKNFMDISYHQNAIEEAKLIASLRPIFNGASNDIQIKPTPRVNKFWENMGLGEIKINYWHTIKVA